MNQAANVVSEVSLSELPPNTLLRIQTLSRSVYLMLVMNPEMGRVMFQGTKDGPPALREPRKCQYLWAFSRDMSEKPRPRVIAVGLGMRMVSVLGSEPVTTSPVESIETVASESVADVFEDAGADLMRMKYFHAQGSLQPA